MIYEEIGVHGKRIEFFMRIETIGQATTLFYVVSYLVGLEFILLYI